MRTTMRTWHAAIPLGLLGLLGFAPSGAGAAEVTHVPPWLRGDLEVGYTYDQVGGSLEEDNQEVGSRKLETHQLTYAAAFSAGPGVAVIFEVPHYAAQRVSFPTANEMVYDASVQTGSMLGSTPLDTVPAVSGSGLGGFWFGLRGTPYNEAFTTRGNLATWLAEIAYRTAPADNFWDADNDRGGGPGGSALRFRMGFSTTHKPAQPYLEATYLHQFPFTVNLYDAQNTLMEQNVELIPPRQVKVRGGVELTAWENTESDAFFNFDLRLAYGYQSWQTIDSGILLPSVLYSSEKIPVTESEYSFGSAGLGIHYRAFRYMQFNLTGDVGYVQPHQIEHPYDVYMGRDTIQFDVGLAMRILVR